MKQIYEDLWQTKLEIPFGSVHAHAYLLKSEVANVLIYNTGHAEELDNIADNGGIKYQFLSHRDEIGDSLQVFKQRFSSELCCHMLEEAAISPSCSVDIRFSDSKTLLANIEVLHTPGHTAGSVTFFYKSPFGRKYLFTGDTLFQSHGEWQTLVFSGAGGSTDSLRESLYIYRDLKPDVVLWSASGGGEVSFLEVTNAQWLEIIDSTINKLGI